MEPVRPDSDDLDFRTVFLKVMLLVRKNFWMVLALFVLGTALGAFYYMLARKQYRSEMIVNSDILREAYVAGVGELLDDIIADENDSLLAIVLNIPPSYAKEIISIKFANTYEARDKSKDEFFLTITAKVYNQKVLPALGQGLINYLENNDYSRKRIEQNKIYLTQVIKKIDEEITALEGFKKSFYAGSWGEVDKNKGNILMNPTDINSKIVELTKERQTLQTQFENNRAIELVQDFTVAVHPFWPKRNISLSSGMIVGLFMVTVVIAFRSVRSLVRIAEASEKK
jgi:hypothetical protein